MEQTILQIQNYLANNELEPALNKLRSVFSISNSELVNDVIILAGQLKKLKSDIRIGIIDYTQENLRHNKIMNSISSLIDAIKNDPDRFNEFDKTETLLDKSIKHKGKGELPVWIKDALFERIAYVKEKELNIKAIWIDDFPINNLYESGVLNSIGLEIEFAKSSEEAKQILSKDNYEIVLSDISRHGKHDEGLRFHKELIGTGIDLPIIFYTGYVERERGVPPFAFGIADMPNDLIHLVLDVIERKY